MNRKTSLAVLVTGLLILVFGRAFHGPMVVMQNERSASDVERFPAGFKALGHVDNTPADFLKGQDAQIEKAVEVLKAEMAGKKTSSAQRQESS